MKLAILLVLNTLLSSVAYGKDGKFTFLGEGQCAVYEGGLFDPTAMAEMVVVVEDLRLDCDLKMEYEIYKIQTAHKLEIDNHHIAYNTLQKKYELLEQSSNIQIDKLQQTLGKVSSTNKWWWFAGGVTAGIASSYGAYRLFNE